MGAPWPSFNAALTASDPLAVGFNQAVQRGDATGAATAAELLLAASPGMVLPAQYVQPMTGPVLTGPLVVGVDDLAL